MHQFILIHVNVSGQSWIQTAVLLNSFIILIMFLLNVHSLLTYQKSKPKAETRLH